MTNFIQINGKKIELTDEQVEQIKNAGVVKDNPFEEAKKGQEYFYINIFGDVDKKKETLCRFDDELFLTANYCTDKKLLEQRALHETLNRLLWRFSMTHGGDEIDWSNVDNLKYYIFYNHKIKSFGVEGSSFWQHSTECYFLDRQTAEQAIKAIVMPFMEQHPEFVW